MMILYNLEQLSPFYVPTSRSHTNYEGANDTSATITPIKRDCLLHLQYKQAINDFIDTFYQ
jgi:hypothetical protein